MPSDRAISAPDDDPDRAPNNGATSGLIAPRPLPLARPRARAYVVGVPLLIGICYVSVYADMVSKTVQFGVLQIAPPAVVALFALALLSRSTSKITGPNPLLSRADLLVVYVMLLIGVLVSTRGAVEKVIPAMAYLPYYGNDANGLHRYITCHLPGWAMPFTPSAALKMPETIRAYYEGLRPGETMSLKPWVGPLLAWAVLIACTVWVFVCLAAILRRRWVDEERLSFPLTRLPLAILSDDADGESFLKSRLMWLGFLVPVIVFGINGLSVNIPNIPHLTLDFNISPLLTERPWSEMDSIRLWTSLAAIGFAYFLPSDLLFSLWFFFLLTRAQDVLAVVLGGQPQSIGSHDARIWTGYQAAGAYLVLVATQIRLGWPSFRTAWRSAFGGGPGTVDDGELLSARAAFLGLFAAFGGIVAWLTLAGMSPLLAVAQMGIYLFVIALIMSRSVSEAGILMTETSFLPSHLIRLVAPLPSLGAQNLSLLAMTDGAFTRDLRGILLAPILDSVKMASETGLRPRALLAPILLAVGIGFAAASYFFLTFSYHGGHLNLYAYPDQNAGNMYRSTLSAIRGQARPPDGTAYGGLLVGVIVTVALVVLRARFAWFPLNPLGYALAPTWTMIVFWFPFFLAWLLKSIIARYGGMRLYRRVAPFMLGMILGEFTMAVFWALMKTPAIGWNAPEFPWP
jgi:hypothetical protein